MVNLFDNANAPKQEPVTIKVGDRVVWRKSDLASTYSSSLYTASYTSRSTVKDGTHEFKVTGAADGKDYVFVINSATTATFEPGHHHYQLEIKRNSDNERVVINSGSWDVITDLDNDFDPRSHAQIMVEKIEGILSGRADADIQSYSIQGRSLTKLSPDELIKWRDYYRAELVMKHRKDAIKNNRATSATIKFRFS